MKGYNSRTAKWNKCLGQGVGKGHKSFYALCRYNTLPESPHVHQPGNSANLIFLGFTETSHIVMTDWLRSWIQPSALPCFLKNRTLEWYWSGLVPLATSPHPYVLYKCHLINIKKTSHLPLHLGNSKSSGSCELGIVKEDQIYMKMYFDQWYDQILYVFFINHNIATTHHPV